MSGVMVGSASDMPVEVQVGEAREGAGQVFCAAAKGAAQRRESARVTGVRVKRRVRAQGIADLLYGVENGVENGEAGTAERAREEVEAAMGRAENA